MNSIEKAFVFSIDHRIIDKPGKDPTDLAALRVRVDRSYRTREQDENGRFIYNRDNDFWANVEVWGPRSKTLFDIVRNGSNVMIVGRWDFTTWTDDTGAERESKIFRASEIAVMPWCIEEVRYKTRNPDKSPGASAEQPESYFEEEMPF